jgi:hypothetical protein
MPPGGVMKIFTSFAIIMLLFAFMPGIPAVHVAGPIDACSIFTKPEAESLFNAKALSQKLEKVRSPAGNMCTYFFKIKGSTSITKVRVSSSEEIKLEGIFKSARDAFERQKKARMAGKDTAKKMRNIPALGEEAFWNGYDLWIIKANYLFVLVAHPHLEGSFPTSEAMDHAREQQDFNYTRNMAMQILSKMN